MSSSWRRLLLPFVPLYAFVAQTKRWLHDLGFLSQRKLHHPVISVGSLSAGGAGKTPVVQTIAKLIGERGFEVRILTRGYGRIGKLTEQVDPEGSASQFGDEPLMLARNLPGAKVFVGSDRYRAGMLAEQAAPSTANAVYLLDDGFQHQKLARDIEILLVTQHDLDDLLLPAGNRREPLRSIRRADFLVLREEETDVAQSLQARLSFPLPPILTIRRQLHLPDRSLTPARPYIFSGLARPMGFVSMLRDLGIGAVATHVFPDHHRYNNADIEHLVTSAQQAQADGFLTTEKDAVKLTSAMLNRLRTVGPLTVVSLDAKLLDESSAIDAIINKLKPSIP